MTGSPPPPLEGNFVSLVGERKALLFSGQTAGGVFSNDVYSFDCAKNVSDQTSHGNMINIDIYMHCYASRSLHYVHVCSYSDYNYTILCIYELLCIA